ncbi:cytochrome P450 [Ganoderma sinense ZZ0214-1]|uniref:Cytochrome P450 n=1 Tax=Ganoderma sinense ZZ0214-1 TaxID=1077348 RepID=A0A2G8SKK0_9APHY|nr:cytochrome P450 [Ganoderma sinense ZZ0214-1]
MHSIYVKDQDNYYRGEKVIRHVGLSNVVSLVGVNRRMLNPVFSGAHMRNLVPLFYDVANRLGAALESRVKDGPKDLDVFAWMGRAALELIGRGGLGYSFDPLVSDSRDVFTESVKKFVPAAADDVMWIQEFTPYLSYLGPAWLRRFLLPLVPVPGIQRLKTISNIVTKRSAEIYFAKKAAIESGDTDLLHAVGEGKDVMSVLLRENMKASEEDRLTDEEVIAQMGTFIVAGVDTTSNALSRILHLLCIEQDVQSHLRSEVREAQEQYGKEIPYDELCALPYLDAICRMHQSQLPVDRFSRSPNPCAAPTAPSSRRYPSQRARPSSSTCARVIPTRQSGPTTGGSGSRSGGCGLYPRLSRTHIYLGSMRICTMTFISGGNACIMAAEIVLSTLVSNFQFALSPDKPIFWNFGGVAYPVTDHASSKPEMNLNVTLASR